MSTAPPPPAVALFCKLPEAGRVKTRLAISIGDARAVAVYRELVRSTLDCLSRVPRPIERFVFFAPADAALRCRAWLGPGLSLVPQVEGDLGARMLAAFRHVVYAPRRPTVLIGTDCPGLTPDHLCRAIDLLEDHDVALGPTIDGGYYLIAAARPHPGLFARVPWSTDRVWDETLERAHREGLRVAALPRLRDIDTLPDLEAACHTDPSGPLAQAAGLQGPPQSTRPPLGAAEP